MFPVSANKRYAMIDLHGLSTEEAERAMNYWLANAGRVGVDQIRFVTGRGNHINAKNERGTLYKSFLAWIDNSIYKNRVEQCTQHDGYFEILLKTTKMQTPVTDFFKRTAKQIISGEIVKIKIGAEQGDSVAQMLYAQLLESGEDVPQDFKAAARYYRLAADQNYPAAMHELARCYFHGVGLRQSDQEAFFWLQKADKLNYIESTVGLGDCYWHGHGVQQESRAAISYYAKAASHQHPLAMRKLASAYKQGIGVAQSMEKAFIWYKKSADLGDAVSQYNVGVMYNHGLGVEQSSQNACHYWELGAKSGDTDAQFFLGYSLWNGAAGIAKDQKKALYWLKMAAENGSAQANHLLSIIGDESSRESYLKRSAQSGNFLDKLLLETHNKNLNETELAQLFGKSIQASFHLDHNDILLLEHDAKFLLIDTMLLENKAKYHLKALDLIQSMAKEKCIFSLRRLAMLYLNGFDQIKIKKEPAKAIDYLQKAVALNDAKSMILLGYLYEHGLHTLSLSLQAAVDLYQKAAEQLHPVGYYNLAILGAQGLLEDFDFSQVCLYLEQVIKLEKDDAAIQSLSSGLLDVYEPYGELAASWLAKLVSMKQAQSQNVSQSETGSNNSEPVTGNKDNNEILCENQKFSCRIA